MNDAFVAGGRCPLDPLAAFAALTGLLAAVLWALPPEHSDWRAFVERLAVRSRGDSIQFAGLPGANRQQKPPLEALQIDLPPGGTPVKAVETDPILCVLEKCNWKQSHAARYLDLSRKALDWPFSATGGAFRAIPRSVDSHHRAVTASCFPLADGFVKESRIQTGPLPARARRLTPAAGSR